jgi:hypothetical protein
VTIDVYKEWLGIPEGERPPGQYDLLRLVEFEDDTDKIRAHYKKLNTLVRKYATGQYSQQSQDLLNELAKAMICLTDPERKREHDEGLGREFDDADEDGEKTLEGILIQQGHISRDQAKEALEFADARGLSMRDAVVQMKLAKATVAQAAYAVELGYPFVDLDDMVPEDEMLDLLPRSFVKRHSIIPLFVDDDMLLVASVHESTPELEDEIRLRYGVPMRPVLATPRAVSQAIAKYYVPGMRDESVAAESAQTSTTGKKSGKANSSSAGMSQLSDDEQKERKQYGWLFICWGVILPVLIDEFVVKPNFMPTALKIANIPSITTLLVAPAVIWWVLTVYWKK